MEFDLVGPTKKVLLEHIPKADAERYPLVGHAEAEKMKQTEEQLVILDMFYYLLEMTIAWEFIVSTNFDASAQAPGSNIWPYGQEMNNPFKKLPFSKEFREYTIKRVHSKSGSHTYEPTPSMQSALREFAVTFARIHPDTQIVNDKDVWIDSARLFTHPVVFDNLWRTLRRLVYDPRVMKWHGQLYPFTRPLDEQYTNRVTQIRVPEWLGLGQTLYATPSTLTLVHQLLSIYVAVIHGGMCSGIYAIILSSLSTQTDIVNPGAKTQDEIYSDVITKSSSKVYSDIPVIPSDVFSQSCDISDIASSLVVQWSKAFVMDEFNDSLFGMFAIKTMAISAFETFHTNRAIRIAFGSSVGARFINSASTHMQLHKGTIPIICNSPTDGHMTDPKFSSEGFPAQLRCNVAFAQLNINEYQEKTRLVAWISHSMGARQQAFNVRDPHDEFVRRNKGCGVWISDLVDARKLESANFTIGLDMASNLTHIPSGKFAEVALCIELYTKTKEPGDLVYMMKRRGMGFVYLTEIAWASQHKKPIRLHIWEGPYNSQFSIASDFSTKRDQTHINTSVLIIQTQQDIRIDPSVMPDVFSTDTGAKKPEIVISPTGPRHVLSFHEDFVEMYEKNFNRYIIHLNDKHIEKGESMYHSDMLLRIPGSPCPRFVETYQPPTPHSIRYYEELLEMHLRRQALTADEFLILGSLVYEKHDDFQVRLQQSGRAGKFTFGPAISAADRDGVRELAHARFWFIVSQFFSFVQIAKYKLDTLDGVGVENMTDVTCTMRDDCENMATAIINFMRRLNELESSKYPPLEFIQRVSRCLVPCHTVMTAKSAAMGSSEGQGPALHMTCLSVPEWTIQDHWKIQDPALDIEWIKMYERPHILEGTGPWAEQTRYYSALFPSDKPSGFEAIYDSTTKYNAIYDSVKHVVPDFIAPSMPVQNMKMKQQVTDPIRNHPFFKGFVDIVSHDIANMDHNLKFVYKNPKHKSEHGIFPPADKVLCRDENVEVTLEDGDGKWVDLMDDYKLYTEKVVSISEYFRPVPIFDGNDKLAYHQESLLFGPKSISIPTTTPHSFLYPPEAKTDFHIWVAHLIRFRTCVFILPYFDVADPIGAKDKVLHALGLEGPPKKGADTRHNFINSYSWTIVEPVVGVPVLELIFYY